MLLDKIRRLLTVKCIKIPFTYLDRTAMKPPRPENVHRLDSTTVLFYAYIYILLTPSKQLQS
jgi:hypothetical protein